jgi:tetratricopeptide (TPR) repeat protein
MFRPVLCVAAALLTFGIMPLSAAADDRATCEDWQSEKAVAACGRLIRQNPNVATYYVNRGLSYYIQSDEDRAIADYDRAIKIDPKNAKAYAATPPGARQSLSKTARKTLANSAVHR